jgi:CCR4-NOT transcription complex subunit 1
MKSAIPVAPDILALALMQANLSNAQKNSPPVVLRQELLAVLLPIFLGNHPNSAIILHHAWHAQVPFKLCTLNICGFLYLLH